MKLKKFFSCLTVFATLFSATPVFANGVLPEDMEVICDTINRLTDKHRRTPGYVSCQSIQDSPWGEPLLKEGLKYALVLGRYNLATKLIGVFREVSMDINEVEGLDYLVVKTGNKKVYDALVESGYKISEPCYKGDFYHSKALLHAAVESENVGFVKHFLEKGFSPNDVDEYDFYMYPLHSALEKIISITDDYNEHGFEYPENRVRVENLKEIIKLLIQEGADPYLYAGKGLDETAITILEELNPDNEENCYSKLEYYPKEIVDFCKKLYSDLKKIISENQICLK